MRFSQGVSLNAFSLMTSALHGSVGFFVSGAPRIAYWNVMKGAEEAIGVH